MLEFVFKYHDDWIRIAYSFLRNKQDAEDLVQDMYIKLHKSRVKKKTFYIKKKSTDTLFLSY